MNQFSPNNHYYRKSVTAASNDSQSKIATITDFCHISENKIDVNTEEEKVRHQHFYVFLKSHVKIL